MLTDTDIMPIISLISKRYGEDSAQHAMMRVTEKYPEVFEKPAFDLERLALTIAYRYNCDQRRKSWRQESLDTVGQGMIDLGEDGEQAANWAERMDVSHSPESHFLAREGMEAYAVIEGAYIQGNISRATFYRKRKKLSHEYRHAMHT